MPKEDHKSYISSETFDPLKHIQNTHNITKATTTTTTPNENANEKKNENANENANENSRPWFSNQANGPDRLPLTINGNNYIHQCLQNFHQAHFTYFPFMSLFPPNFHSGEISLNDQKGSETSASEPAYEVSGQPSAYQQQTYQQQQQQQQQHFNQGFQQHEQAYQSNKFNPTTTTTTSESITTTTTTTTPFQYNNVLPVLTHGEGVDQGVERVDERPLPKKTKSGKTNAKTPEISLVLSKEAIEMFRFSENYRKKLKEEHEQEAKKQEEKDKEIELAQLKEYQINNKSYKEHLDCYGSYKIKFMEDYLNENFRKSSNEVLWPILPLNM